MFRKLIVSTLLIPLHTFASGPQKVITIEPKSLNGTAFGFVFDGRDTLYFADATAHFSEKKAAVQQITLSQEIASEKELDFDRVDADNPLIGNSGKIDLDPSSGYLLVSTGHTHAERAQFFVFDPKTSTTKLQVYGSTLGSDLQVASHLFIPEQDLLVVSFSVDWEPAIEASHLLIYRASTLSLLRSVTYGMSECVPQRNANFIYRWDDASKMAQVWFAARFGRHAPSPTLCSFDTSNFAIQSSWAKSDGTLHTLAPVAASSNALFVMVDNFSPGYGPNYTFLQEMDFLSGDFKPLDPTTKWDRAVTVGDPVLSLNKTRIVMLSRDHVVGYNKTKAQLLLVDTTNGATQIFYDLPETMVAAEDQKIIGYQLFRYSDGFGLVAQRSWRSGRGYPWHDDLVIALFGRL